MANFARNCFSLGYNVQIAIDNKILSCYNHMFVNAFVTRGLNATEAIQLRQGDGVRLERWFDVL